MYTCGADNATTSQVIRNGMSRHDAAILFYDQDNKVTSREMQSSLQKAQLVGRAKEVREKRKKGMKVKDQTEALKYLNRQRQRILDAIKMRGGRQLGTSARCVDSMPCKNIVA